MGIQINYQTNLGIEVDNAYIRINHIEGNKTNITLSVMAYASREAKNEGKDGLWVGTYSFTPDLESANNFIKQA